MSFVLGKVGWTNSPTLGVTVGAEAGLNADSALEVFDDDTSVPSSTAASAGNVNLAFTLRPIANPIFSIIAAAGGSAESDATSTAERLDEVEQSGEGIIQATAGKNAIGFATTAAEGGDTAMAWMHATVLVHDTDDDDFQGQGNAVAINPAQLGVRDPVYDPSVTVTHGNAVYNAAMGSSSESNARRRGIRRRDR